MGLTLESEEGAFQAAHKKPLMCGLGVPVGCRMKHAKGLFKRPIRSHWCGLPVHAWLAARWVWPWKAKKEPWKTKPSDKTFRRKTYLPKACNFHVQMPGSLNWRTKHVIFMSKCLEVLTGGRSMPGKCLCDVALRRLAGCEMGLTLESEEGALKDKTFRQNLPEENLLAQSM